MKPFDLVLFEPITSSAELYHKPADWKPATPEEVDLQWSLYHYWREKEAPEQADKAILGILDLFNRIPGVATLYSCEGHAKWATGFKDTGERTSEGKKIVVPEEFEAGKSMRNAPWYGFYFVMAVTQEGEARAREVYEAILAQPVTVKWEGEWQQFHLSQILGFEHTPVFAPWPALFPESSHLGCVIIRVPSQVNVPLKFKQRVIAHFENILRWYVKYHIQEESFDTRMARVAKILREQKEQVS